MTSEAWVQSAVRLRAAQLGCTLMRNNSGALRDDTGRLIRYGLGNDSAALNAVMKSADLIGWAADGRFMAVECKPPGWRLTPGDKRGQAQARFLDAVKAGGGIGIFATDPSDIDRVLT